MDPDLRVAAFRDLDTITLYALLKLRAEVFVVEQRCAYQDLDGRDTEPGTRHVWLARGHDVVGCLRILTDDGAERIGRVAVARAERGAGHAGRLMAGALEVVGDRACVLAAQSHLRAFYERFGFTVIGPEYLEDGIAHLPMRREPG